VVASLAGVAVLTLCAGGVWRLIEEGPAGIHQTSVMNELAAWEREYSTPRDGREALRAAEMLEYIQNNYVPSPGYRGSVKTETELEAQRTRTQETIVAGLRQFTGQDFGTDVAKWQEWLQQQGHADGR
jgi:hypothetical protein